MIRVMTDQQFTRPISSRGKDSQHPFFYHNLLPNMQKNCFLQKFNVNKTAKKITEMNRKYKNIKQNSNVHCTVPTGCPKIALEGVKPILLGFLGTTYY